MTMRRYVATEIALDCEEGLLTRREALRRLGLLGLTAAASTTLLAACGGDDEEGAPSPTGDAGTPTSSEGLTAVGEDIAFAGPHGELEGSWAAATALRGAVLVIHENRGLTEHIKSIPPRLAADGYSSLAIDLLSAEGGTDALGDEGKAQAAITAAPESRLIADMKAGLDELSRRVPGKKLGIVGFCFGGGLVWRLLDAGEPRLEAAVPFYGPAPDGADFSRSPNAAVLGIYAEEDARVNSTRDAARVALEQAKLPHELRTFAGADHAFFNDTSPRYDKASAEQAYEAVLAWFEHHLA